MAGWINKKKKVALTDLFEDKVPNGSGFHKNVFKDVLCESIDELEQENCDDECVNPECDIVDDGEDTEHIGTETAEDIEDDEDTEQMDESFLGDITNAFMNTKLARMAGGAKDALAGIKKGKHELQKGDKKKSLMHRLGMAYAAGKDKQARQSFARGLKPFVDGFANSVKFLSRESLSKANDPKNKAAVGMILRVLIEGLENDSLPQIAKNIQKSLNIQSATSGSEDDENVDSDKDTGESTHQSRQEHRTHINDAIKALTKLGLNANDAKKKVTIISAQDGSLDTEGIIKKALQK